jgi:hypothetical protein
MGQVMKSKLSLVKKSRWVLFSSKFQLRVLVRRDIIGRSMVVMGFLQACERILEVA